jgi:hypothetical protein
MSELRTDIRVRAEGSGILGKTIVVFLILLYDSRSGGLQGQLALLAFAAGQLAYGTILLAVYYRSFPLWYKGLGAFPWIRVQFVSRILLYIAVGLRIHYAKSPCPSPPTTSQTLRDDDTSVYPQAHINRGG